MSDEHSIYAKRPDWTVLRGKVPEWLIVTLTITAGCALVSLDKFLPQPISDGLFWTLLVACLLFPTIKYYFASPEQGLRQKAEEIATLGVQEKLTLYEWGVLVVFSVIGVVLVAAFVMLSFWIAYLFRR